HDYVNYWMHNGFVRVDNEKMSKSLGNFFTVREILKRYDSEVIRYFILRAHYRSALNYSDQHLNDAKASLSRLYTALKKVDSHSVSGDIDWSHSLASKFKEALDDDFNTPEAISVLFDLASELNRSGNLKVAQLLKGLSGILGLLERDPSEFLQSSVASKLSEVDIESMINQRNEARANKNFAKADQLRKDLLDAGVVLEDSAGKTTWRRS
ncbi:MAG TPA: cysteine--tRNA ligase, partial [Betaproteobacteria bacterium]|nr:cysteine--tRNA ligase [Betaproteobacteria bacterium]